MRQGGTSAIALVAALFLLAAGTAHAADARRGEALYEKHCQVCHSLVPEYHKEGPSLYRIFGTRAGSVQFYSGYRALRGADFMWDEAMLDKWLADPKTFGRERTKMTLTVEDPTDRADIIAYLKSQK